MSVIPWERAGARGAWTRRRVSRAVRERNRHASAAGRRQRRPSGDVTGALTALARAAAWARVLGG